MKKFRDFIFLKEGKENIDQPHVISADPPMKIPAGLERLVEAFKKSKDVPIGKEVAKEGGEKNVTMKGKKLFIVGGAVRDYLLKHTPRDYNLVTDAHPEEVEKICKSAKPPIQVHGKGDGTVRVSVDGESYEIETMRLPGGDLTTEPVDDCQRRDLTINSLYYEPSSKKIYDFTGGLRHIKDGSVKFIGNVKDRFKEDGMRKYRYARMVDKVGGKVDQEVKDAIASHDGDESPEKIREEFWKGLEDLHSNPAKYLKTYKELGLLDTVFPKLELTFDFPDCKTCKSRPIVLASLLKNNRPEKLVSQLKELKYTDREIKDAVFLINLLLFEPKYIYDFKKELLTTSLTKRQILDWAKVNDLDVNSIEKLVLHNFSVNPTDVMKREGLTGDRLRDRIRNMEAEEFSRSLN